MNDFNNKLVVITGAASGMGRAYALAFARRGSRLAICDLDTQGLEETRKLISAIGDNTVYATALDVSDRNAVNDLADLLAREMGGADIVINNAGIEGSVRPTWATSDAQYRKVMEVNFFGVVNGCQAFMPQMRSKPWAAIVNISSIFGLVGTPNHADYCASKFAVRGYTEALMAELYNSSTQVHLVHPGGIDTNITRKEGSAKFSEHYLSTPPQAIAEKLIKAISANKPRLVYGNRSSKTWLGARFLPLRWLTHLVWHEMKHIIDLRDY